MIPHNALKYQIDSEFIPRDLADSLIVAFDAKYHGYFSDLLDGKYNWYSKHRYALAILLLSLCLELKPNKANPNWQALSGKRLRRLFAADDEFIKVVRGSLFFENNHEYSYHDGTCKGARLFPDDAETIAAVIQQYDTKLVDNVLVNHRGKPFDPQHVGRPQYGKTKPLQVCHIAKYVPINEQAILTALQHIWQWVDTTASHPSDRKPRLTEALEAKRTEYKYTKPDPVTAFDKYLKAVCKQLEYLQIFTTTGLPSPIQMSVSGRLYRPFLQGCHRVVREIALQGMYSFDFNACHHVIMQHEAQQAGIYCPYLDTYLIDKQAYREALAQDLGVTTTQAKESLIALAYGAGISHRERFGKPAAIPKILGIEAFLKVMDAPAFNGLAGELKTIALHMRNAAKRKNGQLINARRLPMTIDGNSNATLSAHLIQGVESQLLTTAIRAHNNRGQLQKVVVLPIHDGWITRLERCPIRAEIAVKKRHSIAVAVDRQQYNLLDV